MIHGPSHLSPILTILKEIPHFGLTQDKDSFLIDALHKEDHTLLQDTLHYIRLAAYELRFRGIFSLLLLSAFLYLFLYDLSYAPTKELQHVINIFCVVLIGLWTAVFLFLLVVRTLVFSKMTSLITRALHDSPTSS